MINATGSIQLCCSAWCKCQQWRATSAQELAVPPMAEQCSAAAFGPLVFRAIEDGMGSTYYDRCPCKSAHVSKAAGSLRRTRGDQLAACTERTVNNPAQDEELLFGSRASGAQVHYHSVRPACYYLVTLSGDDVCDGV
jgi:hypothetical protein